MGLFIFIALIISVNSLDNNTTEEIEEPLPFFPDELFLRNENYCDKKQPLGISMYDWCGTKLFFDVPFNTTVRLSDLIQRIERTELHLKKIYNFMLRILKKKI